MIWFVVGFSFDVALNWFSSVWLGFGRGVILVWFGLVWYWF